MGFRGVFPLVLAVLIGGFWLLVLVSLASIATELKKIRLLLEQAHGSPVARGLEDSSPPPAAGEEDSAFRA